MIFSLHIYAPLNQHFLSICSIRGFLISSMILAANFGFLISFILGTYVNIFSISIFIIVLAVLFEISLFFMPESPTFLIKQGKIDVSIESTLNDKSILTTLNYQVKSFLLKLAEKSIRFYKNLRKTDEHQIIVDLEINKVQTILANNQIESQNKTSIKWSDFTTKTSSKAILIGVVLIILNTYNGNITLSNYTKYVFDETGSNLSTDISSIIVAVIQIVGVFAATQLVDRLGRKLLILSSIIGAALGLVVLGIYMMLKLEWSIDVTVVNWIPLVSFSWCMLITSVGIQALAFTVITEIMPERIKESGVTFCTMLMWIFAFINIKFLPLITTAITFHGAMFLYAAICLIGAVFILLIMPETKGKNHEEIMKSLQ